MGKIWRPPGKDGGKRHLLDSSWAADQAVWLQRAATTKKKERAKKITEYRDTAPFVQQVKERRLSNFGDAACVFHLFFVPFFSFLPQRFFFWPPCFDLSAHVCIVTRTSLVMVHHVMQRFHSPLHHCISPDPRKSVLTFSSVKVCSGRSVRADQQRVQRQTYH